MITGSGLLDGSHETLTFNGYSIPLVSGGTGSFSLLSGTEVEYTIADGATNAADKVITFTRADGGNLSNDHINELIQGMDYLNTSSTNATAGERVFEYSVRDQDNNDSRDQTSTFGATLVTSTTTGVDTLTGNAGADHFSFNSIADGDDIISGFSFSDNDRLDLDDLLDYDASTDTLADFLTVSDDGTDVTVTIDVNGDGSGTDVTLTLAGIGTGSLDLDDLTPYLILG